MRNFNPMFNSINMMRNSSPFATAGSSFVTQNASRGLLSKIGTSKISLSGILNGAQKTIGTVNQIVPLYNQIKPMFQNSKILFSLAKGLKGTSNTTRNNRRNKNIFSNNTIEVTPEIKKEEETNNDSPSKPFFV